MFVEGSAKNISWAIKRLRESRKMSARQLSLKSGLSPSYVAKVESGEIDPSFKAFARIAMVLEMSMLEIFFCIIGESPDDDDRGPFYDTAKHDFRLDELQSSS